TRDIVRMTDVIDAGNAGAEVLAVMGEAADRDAAEIYAVVTALAANEPEALRLAARTVIGERDLEGAVDRLGTRVGEEDALEALRRNGGQPVSELERDRMAHLEGRGEIHL